MQMSEEPRSKIPPMKVNFIILLLLVAASQARSPNVVFLLADDFGWGDLGVLHDKAVSGDMPPKTPFLDTLSTEGTLFTGFHTLNPVCSPSRASFVTGQFPTTVRIPTAMTTSHKTNAARGMADFLDLKAPILPRLLKEGLGYRTAHYGKWHLGSTDDAPFPTAYGLDDAITYCSNKDSPQLGNFSDPWFPANSSGLIVDHAINFARNASASGVPFYVALWFHISHAPLNPSPEQLREFPTSQYCRLMYDGIQKFCPIQVMRASQHNLDTQIGRFLTFLKAQNLEEDTIVLFSADNGPEDEHVYYNSVGSAGPFRGRKRSLYEGGVPFIAKWPGHIPAKRSSAADFASVDVIPTIANLTGLQLTPDAKKVLVGRDFSDVLLGHSVHPPPRTTPLMFDWRFGVAGHCWNEAPRLAIRDDKERFKLLVHPNMERVELYNTSEVFEAINIADKHSDVVERLSAQVIAWMKTQPASPPDSIILNPGCVWDSPRVSPLEWPEGAEDLFHLA